MDNQKEAETGDVGQPKRRACDECRSRKLACSKEPDGCARCKREKIRCNYSAQKPMGRPRKRPRGEAEAGESHQDDGQIHQQAQQRQQQQQQQGVSFNPQPELDMDSFNFDFSFDNTIGMDLELSFLDMDNQNLNFFDLVTGQDIPSSLNITPGVGTLQQQQQQQPYLAPLPSTAGLVSEDPGDSPKITSWYTGTLGSIDVNFDPAPPVPAQPQAQEFSPEKVAAHIHSHASPERTDSVPSLSPDSSASGPSSSTTWDTEPAHESDLDPKLLSMPAAIPTSSIPGLSPAAASPVIQDCECFSKLYLALDAVQHLPAEVGAAMRVARNAAKTAYHTVICPVCGDPPVPPPHPSLKPFQNMMMLGALLPSLSNAYVRILEMVDAAAARAEAAAADGLGGHDNRIIFSLRDYGGVWGRMAEEEKPHCDMSRSIDGAAMEPATWRLTARALLRFDVYGYNRETDPESSIAGLDDQKPFVQIGLKDIMDMMEERSRRRHEQLDAMVAAGTVTIPPGCIGHSHGPGGSGGTGGGQGGSGERPQCMAIIDIAKKSMANLTIP